MKLLKYAHLQEIEGFMRNRIWGNRMIEGS